MKRFKENFFTIPIIAGTLVIFLCFAIAITIVVMNKKQKLVEAHDYVETVVVDKQIVEGYAGFYVLKPTEYFIVSEYEENGQKHTVTTSVSYDEYFAYNTGDKILYCKNHNKLIIYEK